MNERVMSIERAEDGVCVRYMPVWVVDTLMRVPEWLESDDERVRDRLVPAAYEDEEAEQEWRAHTVPELEHLFQSRTEIVRKDLQQLRLELEEDLLDTDDVAAVALEDGMTFCLAIPAVHFSAWLTSLQAATHAVFVLEGLTEEDIGKDPREETNPERQLAMMRLLILQELLVMLCEE